MPNQKIFCSVPWHNTHLYWDGTYGACCFESQAPIGQQANIKNTSLVQWYNSDAMKKFRHRILGDVPLPECSGCYSEESYGHQSRRIKENFKVGIFTEQAFDHSFEESAWNKHFTTVTDQQARDWHVDFGNECNLACKMCHPGASSRIAQQYVKWGMAESVTKNWTTDPIQWQQFLDNVNSNQQIRRIHVMGGEPMINKRYVQFVQYLVDHERTSISMSFVSNGTLLNSDLIDLLKKFKEVNIEISIESISDNNHYIRQGSNTAQILDNVQWLRTNTNFQIVLRSVPQLLNVNNYDQYIRWAFDCGLSIQSVPLQRPDYLAINVLPHEIRLGLIERYIQVKEYIAANTKHINTISVGRDTSRLGFLLMNECDMIVNQLNAPTPSGVQELRSSLIDWLIRWDQVYTLNALDFYPEYHDFLTNYGYRI